MSLAGGCQCGAVRYDIKGEPLALVRCHCKSCQAQAASAFGLSLYAGPQDVSFSGQIAFYSDITGSGKRSQRAFCPVCGTRLYHALDPVGDYLSIKAGSLDAGYDLVPVAEIWTRSKLPWVPLIPDILRYDQQPPDHNDIRAAWQADRQGKTLAFYDQSAAEYADWSTPSGHPRLTAFLETLPAAARILDFGAGTAWATAVMLSHGFTARALDGSTGLARQALTRFNIPVEILRFEEFTERGTADAIWAFFSLMHAPRDQMPRLLARLYDALTPEGMLYLGLKEGQGAFRDDQGRLYTLYTSQEITKRLEHGGFTLEQLEHGMGKNFDGSDCHNLYIMARRNG